MRFSLVSPYPYPGSPAGRPAPTAGPRPGPARPPRWGWLEWVLVSQTLFPALLFVPGMSKVRIVTRFATYGIVALAWVAAALRGRPAPGRPFPAAPWLGATAAWLVLSIFHPTTNSLLSGAAEAALIITIFSPAFWAPSAMASPRQLERMMVLLFLCNALSTLVGIGQFYRPDTFNPPALSTMIREEVLESLMIETADGRRVFRPFGLTDSPGGACTSGAMTALIGLCLAIRPIARWKRLACFATALAGVAVIYLSQARSALVVLVVCLAAIGGMLALRRDFKEAALLGAGGVSAVLLAFAWALRSGGEKVVERFVGLVRENPGELYYKNRGYFLEQTLERHLWRYPMGAGMGRLGMMYAYFGDKTPSADRGGLYAEIQWSAWLLDGGIPLILLYSGAIAAAIYAAGRVGLSGRGDAVSFWAMPVCALGLSFAALCFSGIPFITQAGVQFWVLFASAHAAAEITMRESLQQRRAER